MNQLPPSLRKAAVLIASLDERTADAMLESMSADEAAKVRSALVTLGDIPADEQRRVLVEFFRRQGSPALATLSSDDVALELSSAVDAPATELKLYSPPRPEELPDSEPALAFLTRGPVAALAGVLRGEHPQTAAVVIAQLPPERAALVLEGLPASLATDALERMAWLGDIAAEVVTDLARELREQLAPHLRAAAADASSLAHVSAVLAAMGGRQRQRALEQLAERNTTLGERLGARQPVTASGVQESERVLAFRYRLGPPLRDAAAGDAGEQDADGDVAGRLHFAAAV
jgi:flagellar motor switch protein FliG